MIEAGDIGLPDGWRDRCVTWAQSNGSICELWLFGSRGPGGGARMESDVDIGITLMPKIRDHFEVITSEGIKEAEDALGSTTATAA